MVSNLINGSIGESAPEPPDAHAACHSTGTATADPKVTATVRTGAADAADRDKRRPILVGLFGLAGFAWILTIVASLVAPNTSGGTFATLAAIGGHSHALTADVGSGGMALWVALVLTAVSWIVMTVAMMLPSSIAMMTMFAATAKRGPRWKRSYASFIGGYLAVWSAAGIAAFLFSLGVAWIGETWTWLGEHWQVVPAAALAAAALWQLTPLKDACLKACRTPLSFMMQHFKSTKPGPSFMLGARHGKHCFGCCWALMLVMVFFGTAHLVTMGVLALIMLVEKAAPWGDRLVRPIGVALALAAVAVLFLGGQSGGEHHHHAAVAVSSDAVR
ncbi:DUF2182 domain-containing protein [Gordonia hydrophobica]|uniref:DUF2182 domain-containing protein n=1 Tax=Gordonia hydrophobica TaxID=40516 RepID=A0ABZ2U5M4_9ACTN|nr:DUF2182 domain-containing protein [Gordonia hydrophobica]MBM7368689.1 putative metal-binding membrane protein [Gordonia hydrophobica]